MLYVDEAIPSKGVDRTDLCYLDFVYWRARTIAMHELDHLTDLQNKLTRQVDGSWG